MKQVYIETKKQKATKVNPLIKVFSFRHFINKKDERLTGENIFLIQNFRKGPPGHLCRSGAYHHLPRMIQSLYFIQNCNYQSIINQHSFNQS